MRYEKLYLCVVMVTVMTVSGGCGIFTSKVSPVSGDTQHSSVGRISISERNFVAALQALRNGDEPHARDLLVRIVDESNQAGVVDEAMFRLALLYLRDEDGKGDRRANELIERLSNEYPNSVWTRQAAPLYSYLRSSIVLRNRVRELKSLRNQNLSLSRDNKELRQSLDRIKNLDIELEQKIRR